MEVFRKGQGVLHIFVKNTVLWFNSVSSRVFTRIYVWDVKGNRANCKSEEQKIIKHYQRISNREAFVTDEMIRNAYLLGGGEIHRRDSLDKAYVGEDYRDEKS